MYILDINMMKKEIKKFLIGTIVCAVFALIYEQFSHQVYSNFMILAFLIPLIAGAGIYILLNRKGKLRPNNLSNELYKMSILTFTFGSLMKGVIDIYGTTNSFLKIYPIVGTILLICAIITYIVKNKIKREVEL